MNTAAVISRSGLQAAQTRLEASAHNVANSQTSGFEPLVVQQATQSGGGVSTRVGRLPADNQDMERDMVAQLQAKNALLANLSVFKTHARMVGSVLDVQA
jgi:flagellar basal body rod protein FlgC